MTRTFQTVLTVALLVALVAGGIGTAAAEQTEIKSGDTTVVNDDDLIDVDELANNISINALGVQIDDTVLSLLSG